MNFTPVFYPAADSHRVVLAACLALLLGACGDSGKNGNPDTPPPDPQTSASPPIEDIPPVADLPAQNATAMAEVSHTSGNAEPETATSAAPETGSEPAAPAAASQESADAPATPMNQPTAAAAPTAQSSTPANGMEIYKTYCQTCHMSGLNGSIKYGDKIRWGKVTAQGRETVYQHALNGIRNMPPKGGFPNLTDEEVKAAVDYIVNGSGGWKG